MIKTYKKVGRFIFAIPLVFILLFTSFAGFLQVRENLSGIYESIISTTAYPSAVAVNVSRTIDGERKTQPQKENCDDNSGENIFLLSNANIPANSLSLIAALCIFSGLLFFLVPGSEKKIKEYRSHLDGRLRYYLQWSLKFLSPIQKSILNRADVYDINPIKGYVFGEKNPRFVCDQNAGFFYES